MAVAPRRDIRRPLDRLFDLRSGIPVVERLYQHKVWRLGALPAHQANR